MSSIVAGSILASEQLNYLYPQYALPWNNFFGKVNPLPFYLGNELRNIKAREVHSPLTFDSLPSVNYKSGSVVPTWSTFNPALSKSIVDTASKVFVGQYFDRSADIRGLEYQYDFTGTQVFVLDTTTIQETGLLILSLNLANQSLTTNLPVYVDTAICDPCNQIYQSASLNRCQVGNSSNFYTTLQGVVSVAGTTYSLDNALPYKNTSVNCSETTPASVLYYIAGNRLLISVPITGDDTPARQVSYAVTIRIVETRAPIQNALSPFIDLPPYSIL